MIKQLTFFLALGCSVALAERANLQFSAEQTDLPSVFEGQVSDDFSQHSVVLVIDKPQKVTSDTVIASGWELYEAAGRYHPIRIQVKVDTTTRTFVMQEFPAHDPDSFPPEPVVGVISADMRTIISSIDERHRPSTDIYLKAAVGRH